MTSIGQRIKFFRKSSGMSQSELAEKLYVSVQTVSKWECDSGTPDIIQIVPLAQVFGISCDAILGVDNDEQGYIDGVIASFREKWLGKNSLYNTEYLFAAFQTCKEIARRYPTNYSFAIECIRRGENLLKRTVHDHLDVPEGCNVNNVYRDIIKIAQSIINYDTNLERKTDAKSLLVLCHYIMGNNEQAEAEYEGLPKDGEYITRMMAAGLLSDREKQIDAARKYYSCSVWEFEVSLWYLADAYSVCGKEKREEAKRIIKKDIEILGCLEGFLDEKERLNKLISVWVHLSKQYLRDGDFEDVVDCAEVITDLCEKYEKIKNEPENGTTYFDNSVMEFGMTVFHHGRDYEQCLFSLYNECADLEGNPVVTNPRFKACEERIKALKNS